MIRVEIESTMNYLDNEIMWNDPSDRLSHNFRLIIIALDRDEDLAKCSRLYNETHELDRQSTAQLNEFLWQVGQFGESRIQAAHAETVV